ncbi:hypothetical protein OPQ81_008321 [Rhizoctonia solani]|nr:hypothetical protein OPQ81_008321 [Rhizoctonia solani]
MYPAFETRAENDLLSTHALDLYYYVPSNNTGLYHEHKDIRRRAQPSPNPRKNKILEYIKRAIQLWDAITTSVKPTHCNATITRIGETFAKVVCDAYINAQDLNRAFQSAIIRLRGCNNLPRALITDFWKFEASNSQQLWIHPGSLVDHSGTIESCIIGSSMTIAEISSVLSRYCCNNPSHLLRLCSCSAHPILRGGFGDIYSGKLENGTIVAIKVARYSNNISQFGKQSKHTAKEVRTWAKCEHPNVLPLLGMIEFRGQIAMVSPWMKNGDLRSYLGQNPEADRCQLCYDICDGLVYLHGINIVHGDLKGANVLIGDNGKAMLTDFGNSLMEDKTFMFTVTTRDAACSSRWAAPEILEGSAASYPADIFALGMTLLVHIAFFPAFIATNESPQEAITGDVPYRELEREQAVIAAILLKKVIPARPTSYIPHNSPHGDLLWDLLTRCWVYAPADRPYAEQVQGLMSQITKKGLL